MSNEQIAYLNFLIEKMVFYSVIIMPTIGIFTNILNIAICMRKKLRTSLLGYYNFLISTFNILLFIDSSIVYLPPAVYQKDLSNSMDFLCWSLSFISRVLPQMAIWINVFLMIDRFLSVSFPGRFRFKNDRKKLSWIMFSLFIALVILNISNVFYKITIQTNEIKVCSAINLIILIRNMEIALFGVILPTLFHIIFSIILILKLYQTRRNLNLNMTVKRDRRFTLIVLALNVLFCLTELPYSIVTLYLGIKGIVPSYPMSQSLSYSQALMNFIFYVTFVFSGFNFNSLLLVNLMFNKIFQKEIRKILFGLKKMSQEIW